MDITFSRQSYCKSYEIWAPTWDNGSRYVVDILRTYFKSAPAAMGPVAYLGKETEDSHTMIGIAEPRYTTIEALYKNPASLIRHALFHGAKRVVVACNYVRGSSEPRSSDLEGAAKLRCTLELCGLHLEDVFFFGEDGYASLSGRGAFETYATGARRRAPRYRKGQHEAPEHALQGFYGEEIAAIYDVLNRSTIADAEALLTAARMLELIGPVMEAEGHLSEQDREKIDALEQYAETADAEELKELAVDYGKQAIYRLRLLEKLCASGRQAEAV